MESYKNHLGIKSTPGGTKHLHRAAHSIPQVAGILLGIFWVSIKNHLRITLFFALAWVFKSTNQSRDNILENIEK